LDAIGIYFDEAIFPELIPGRLISVDHNLVLDLVLGIITNEVVVVVVIIIIIIINLVLARRLMPMLQRPGVKLLEILMVYTRRS
jgi:uncharacterized membrane protein (DUF441 family)